MPQMTLWTQLPLLLLSALSQVLGKAVKPLNMKSSKNSKLGGHVASSFSSDVQLGSILQIFIVLSLGLF
jgi:hypothetical protein